METDVHLLSRYHHQGDAEAFQTLVEAHAGMVHATAHRVTRDTTLAQDVTQETFLALARSSGAAIQCVGAWLHHVAWQKAGNAARGESRRHRHEAAAAAEQLQQPHDEAAWADLEPMLDEALEELPATVRDLLIERFLEGCTQQEVARRRGLSQSTVSRLLTNAITDLRTLLKAKGVVCGSGLGAMLSTHGTQAAPPALTASLGKLGISGVGVSASTITLAHFIPSIIMKALASKLVLAGAALLLFGTAGYDLASADSWLLGLVKNSPSSEATSSPVRGKSNALKKAGSMPPMAARGPETLTVSLPGAPLQSDSPQARRLKLSGLSRLADFKALMTKLFASADPSHVVAELKRLMGLVLTEREVAAMMKTATVLELGVLTHLALRHPQEALGWLAMLEGNGSFTSSVVLSAILQHYPDITAESIAATLPAGPNREHVLSVLRAQRDPVTEAQRLLSTVGDPATRQQRLWSLAEHWPKGQTGEAVKWALQNLQDTDLRSFLPRLLHHLSTTSPDEALSLLGQINSPDLLSISLIDSLHGLVNENPCMADVLLLIDKLQGKERSTAIAELSRRWVRVDQQGLVQWINGLESPADFESALPLTLAQLTPDNYAKAMDTLMPQLDGTLDAAIIKAAMPDFAAATRITIDIIQRFTQLPQYSRIGSGQQGNQELLWQAVNKTAGGWVTQHGAKAQQGAQWIDGLTFNTAADKATVAARLYDQWKVSDPAAAAQWATRAGVKVE